MRLRGRLAELLAEVDPKTYGPYLHKNKKGESVLYVCLGNAMYGKMRASLLWYEKFVDSIKSIGFELNPYDPCVANKTINSTQCTVAWHIDDLKISHKDKKVVDKFIEDLEKKFGKVTPLSKS